jgi:hypothetical protein
MDVSNNRLFRFSKPEWLNNSAVRNGGVYVAGALVSRHTRTESVATKLTPAQFAAGFFFLIDVASFSRSPRNGSDVHIKFVDWVPGICSVLGMLVINSIEKSRLQADSFSYSGSGVAWKARFVLFLGFALLAGGLAGSVVCIVLVYWNLESDTLLGCVGGRFADCLQTVMVLKYLIKDYPITTLYFGIANVVANGLVMLRYVLGFRKWVFRLESFD